jgi:aminoglycoside 3-N-acetyltransferase I
MVTVYSQRRLTPTEIAPMRALLQVFAQAFDEAELYAAAPPSDAELSRRLALDHVIVLAAFDADGAVVGGLIAYVLDKFEQARREIYLYDLAVAEAHRRRGVARDLIHALRSIATDVGASVVFVQADPVDAPALALYRSLGHEERVVHFDLRLTE